MVYMKVIILNTIYNFVVDFFYFKPFRVPNMRSNFIYFEIQNLEFLNLVHIVNTKAIVADLNYMFADDKFFILIVV